MENKWTYQTVEAVNEEDKKDRQLSEWCTLFKTGFQGSKAEITEMLGVLFEGLHKIKKMIVKQTATISLKAFCLKCLSSELLSHNPHDWLYRLAKTVYVKT